MGKKASKETKSKIVSAAWKLFYEQGYEHTTVEDILALSGTSKGTFYHYFEGKDALLGSLSMIFDEKYEELMNSLDPEMDAFDKLMYLNRELFAMIENSVPIELLARLYSTQLVTKGEKHLLDRNRTYYRLLRTIASEGQRRGELRGDMSVNDITRLYAMCERALIIEWCLCNWSFSLKNFSERSLPMLLNGIKK